MKYFFTALFTLFILAGTLQAKNKNTVQIKIKKQGTTILDTTITESDKNIKPTIENILARYTNEQIYIDTDKIHGLYVFEIQDTQKNNSAYNDISINIDSIFTQFSRTLEYSLRSLDLDSISLKAENFADTVINYTRSFEPDITKVKQEIKDLTDKIKNTRIVIIEKGDTIKIPE